MMHFIHQFTFFFLSEISDPESINCVQTLPCPSAPLQSCGCYESSAQSEPHPMFLKTNNMLHSSYESCMDLKSKGIFVSGKFKFTDGSEEFCPGWGKYLNINTD